MAESVVLHRYIHLHNSAWTNLSPRNAVYLKANRPHMRSKGHTSDHEKPRPPSRAA